jgi:hypothetical protein
VFTTPNQPQSQSLPQEIIYGVAAAVAIIAIVAVVLVKRKRYSKRYTEEHVGPPKI